MASTDLKNIECEALVEQEKKSFSELKLDRFKETATTLEQVRDGTAKITLRMKGEEVKKGQELLKTLHKLDPDFPNIEADGFFGKGTLNALTKVQAVLGISDCPSYGRLDQATLEAIENHIELIDSDTRSEKLLLSSTQQIKNIQNLLNDHSFSAGVADGVIGPQTRGAIKLAQEKFGLPVTGHLSEELLTSLKAPTLAENPLPQNLASSLDIHLPPQSYNGFKFPGLTQAQEQEIVLRQSNGDEILAEISHSLDQSVWHIDPISHSKTLGNDQIELRYMNIHDFSADKHTGDLVLHQSFRIAGRAEELLGLPKKAADLWARQNVESTLLSTSGPIPTVIITADPESQQPPSQDVIRKLADIGITLNLSGARKTLEYTDQRLENPLVPSNSVTLGPNDIVRIVDQNKGSISINVEQGGRLISSIYIDEDKQVTFGKTLSSASLSDGTNQSIAEIETRHLDLLQDRVTVLNEYDYFKISETEKIYLRSEITLDLLESHKITINKDGVIHYPGHNPNISAGSTVVLDLDEKGGIVAMQYSDFNPRTGVGERIDQLDLNQRQKNKSLESYSQWTENQNGSKTLIINDRSITISSQVTEEQRNSIVIDDSGSLIHYDAKQNITGIHHSPHIYISLDLENNLLIQGVTKAPSS